MAKVKLKRRKIEKFRDVTPGTELGFNDTFNVPLGKNGTGQTTLLRLIAMVVAGDFAALKETEFAFEYEIVFPGMGVRLKLENRNIEDAHGRSRADLIPPPIAGWSYRAEMWRDASAEIHTISGSP